MQTLLADIAAPVALTLISIIEEMNSEAKND
jgi:hypothetical protein